MSWVPGRRRAERDKLSGMSDRKDARFLVGIMRSLE